MLRKAWVISNDDRTATEIEAGVENTISIDRAAGTLHHDRCGAAVMRLVLESQMLDGTQHPAVPGTKTQAGTRLELADGMPLLRETCEKEAPMMP